MENSIEDRINNAYCFLNSMHSDFRTGLYYKEDLENLEHILSDYKRVLKENERYKKSDYETICLENNELREITDRIQSEYNDLLKDNFKLKNELETKRKEYQETYKDVREELKELRKENEELNNRCRNLDKEAQAYLEELAGDNTLTRRTIKQLQEENEELKDFKKQVTDIESTNFIKYKNYIPIQKIKAKIEELDIAISECIYLDEDDKAYKKAVKKDKLCLLNQKRALQELLEGRE